MPYSIEIYVNRDEIFVKGYEFKSFAKNKGKNISKILSSKYGWKLIDHVKQSATKVAADALKPVSKKVIKKKQMLNWFIIKSPIKLEKTQDTISLPHNNLQTKQKKSQTCYVNI